MKKALESISDIPQIIYDHDGFPRAGEGQCDCACVEAVPLGRSVSTVQPSKSYTRHQHLQIIPIDDNNVVALTEQVEGAIVLNQQALTIADFFCRPQRISDVPSSWFDDWGVDHVNNIISQMIRLGLLKVNDQVAPFLSEAATTLTAWLHITDRCNLRCTYCYLPHNREDMSEEVGKAAIDATFRSAIQHGYGRIKLKYAGGEPLICFSTIVNLHRYAQGLATEHHINLDGVVLSNGILLTPELISNLKSLGLRLMISLDGLGQYHDKQRIFANGQGTFAHVAESIVRALDMGLIPDISITVSGRNAQGLPDLITWILKRDLPFSLNFYRENELSASYPDMQLEEQKIIESMLATFQGIEANLPRRNLLPSLVDRANLATPHLRTCGVGHSYLVFDYHGRIAKCQMALGEALTDVTEADPLSVIRRDKIGLQNISVNDKEGCRDCEWKSWCTGGCSLATYRATGRYDVQSPNCNIYKALYPRAVRLEGLRLLKYGRSEVIDSEHITEDCN